MSQLSETMSETTKHAWDRKDGGAFGRREFLRAAGVGAAGALLVSPASGCLSGPREVSADAGELPAADVLLEPTPQCLETETNALGPFYRAGAPVRSNLVEPGMAGTLLTVSGRVLSTGCAPVGAALIDVWQADDAGAYDNVGYTLRGQFNADASGHYVIETIVPGRYLNGATYRPSHIHVRVSAPGSALLTTQLYFTGDPFNALDGLFRPSLAMTLADTAAGGKVGSFDFVLAPA